MQAGSAMVEWKGHEMSVGVGVDVDINEDAHLQSRSNVLYYTTNTGRRWLSIADRHKDGRTSEQGLCACERASVCA